MNKFLLLSGFVFAASAQALASSLLSVDDSPKLKEYLRIAGEVAENGPSLEALIYSEHYSVSPETQCRTGSADDLASYVAQVVSSMDWAAESEKARLSELEYQALIDLRELIGNGPVQICFRQYSSEYSLTAVTTFKSSQRSYSITFRLGYED